MAELFLPTVPKYGNNNNGHILTNTFQKCKCNTGTNHLGSKKKIDSLAAVCAAIWNRPKSVW